MYSSVPTSPPLPPNPSLLAILLITRSNSLGPRLIFHYPPSTPGRTPQLNSSPRWYGSISHTTDDGSSPSAPGKTGNNSEHSSSTDDSDSSRGFSGDELNRVSRDGNTESVGDDNRDKDSRMGFTVSAAAEVGSRASGTRSRGAASRGVSWMAGEELEGESPEDTSDISGYVLGSGGGSLRTRNGLKGSNVPAAGKGKDIDAEWENVLGFRAEALEKMLTPGRNFNKKRFEVGVEGCVFVGTPMFVREDGYWKKRKKRKERMQDMQARTASEVTNIGNPARETRQSSTTDKTEDGVLIDQDEVNGTLDLSGFEPGYGHDSISGHASRAPSEADSDAKSASTTAVDGELTMFNVVFVLNPPALEYQLRVKEMYENVVRKFAKALKFQQAKSNYVWKESVKILGVKNKAKENRQPISSVWHKIMFESALAKSIAIIFDSISSSKIAHVNLDTSFDTSFQIPQAISIPYIPRTTEPQMPGLWLTTANVVDDEDTADATFTQHLALLLLEDTETLVKEIEGDAKDSATPLAFYIRNLVPTKSLQKLATLHSIPPPDIEFIAGHLVYWRRARLIPPLHPRDTYIVSPNADLRALGAAIPAFAARFPTLPSLPKILNMLSAAPRPYGTFIPSSDHRAAYMDILAWLMRGGWVTQLRTFAWIRVPAEVKVEVAALIAEEVKAEEEAAKNKAIEDEEASLSEGKLDNGRSSSLSGRMPMTPARKSPNLDESELPEALSASTLFSPRLAPFRSPAKPSSDTGSSSSALNSIRVTNSTNISPQSQTSLAHRPSPLHLNRTASPSLSNFTRSSLGSTMNNGSNSNPLSPTSPESRRHESRGSIASVASGTTITSPLTKTPKAAAPVPSQKDMKPSLVLSPTKASALEARWLEHIGSAFEDKELREAWPVLLKYFDGKHALDDIAVREGWKRKRVWALLGQVKDKDLLITVRHW